MLRYNWLLINYWIEQYEVSNFSKPGFESVHNMNYWLGESYIGLGVGAHGFTGRRRYWNTSRLADYIKNAGTQTGVEEGFEDLTDYQLTMERVLFGLRMNQGIPSELIPPQKRDLIGAWAKDGFILFEEGRVKVTDQGRLVLDELSARLI